MKRKMIIPIFISHKGCKNDCVFCNQKRITGVKQVDDYIPIGEKINEYIGELSNYESVEIAFFGGSFTGIDKNLQRKYLGKAQEYVDKYRLDGIRLSTRPDYIDEEQVKLLKEFSVKAVELGVQSMDEEVLRLSGRGYKSEAVYKASEILKSHGLELGLQMMIGLPGDIIEKSMYTAEEICKMAPDTVRIYPTVIMKDTYLEKMYKEGQYKPLALDEAIFWCAQILPLFYRKNITIMRVGLQASEEVSYGNGIVEGPFHPAFKQLVEEYMLHKFIIKLYNGNDMIIYANQKLYQSLIGHGRKFAKLLYSEKWKIKFALDKSLKFDEIIINSRDKSEVFSRNCYNIRDIYCSDELFI